ncbi:hypothetical protein Tco_0862716 [Tanacetum coccineum]
MESQILCLRLQSMETSIQNCCSISSSLSLFNLRAATSINSPDQKRYLPCGNLSSGYLPCPNVQRHIRYSHRRLPTGTILALSKSDFIPNSIVLDKLYFSKSAKTMITLINYNIPNPAGAGYGAGRM